MTHANATTNSLQRLEVGQSIPFGGDKVAIVSRDLADAFVAGDRLVVVQDTGDLLHIPASEHQLVAASVDTAVAAFGALSRATDEQIAAFYDAFARRIEDDATFAAIADANQLDVASATARGRSTTRLAMSSTMRTEMVAGLRVWRDTDPARDEVTEVVEHDGWTVTARRAPLGVVGFVFEGRPNVFADATGVMRTGNTAVLRIGSDALGTARAIMQHALVPALQQASLDEGTITLIDSPSRAAGWALFSDPRLGLAVARGSGEAVTQLGAVARQAGVPVSLHGTGGAWLFAGSSASTEVFGLAVRHSLDRKVCNTLNVCCVVADRAGELVPVFVEAASAAAADRGTTARIHVVEGSEKYIAQDAFSDLIPVRSLAVEWEWDATPEISLVVVADLATGVRQFNELSPRLAASLISNDDDEQQWFYDTCDAPFIGNGFTRWVDGQFALNRPELGLSNWQAGRLFARSAVLSGDSVYTVRLQANIADAGLHR